VDCVQRWETVCAGSKSSRQQVHICPHAQRGQREMVKGEGAKGVGLVRDLLPSLLEGLGRDEAASAREKARN